MTDKLDRVKLRRFLEALGAGIRSRGACYLTGGASALWEGWRETTIDIDIRLDPEPTGAFDAIPRLKRELGIHVELASPADFLPPLEGWRERSRFIGQFGDLQVFHYDFLSQALAKIERGHTRDLEDVEEMLRRGLVGREALLAQAEAIRPQLGRYPAVDEETFLRDVREFVEGHSDV